jgi:hypothetical protein
MSILKFPHKELRHGSTRRFRYWNKDFDYVEYDESSRRVFLDTGGNPKDGDAIFCINSAATYLGLEFRVLIRDDKAIVTQAGQVIRFKKGRARFVAT